MDQALAYSGHNKQFMAALGSTQEITITVKDGAELLLGKCDLSSRGYNNLKNILGGNNVVLPTYNNAITFCNNLDIGNILPMHTITDDNCQCMGYKTDIKETLQRIVSTNELFSMF